MNRQPTGTINGPRCSRSLLAGLAFVLLAAPAWPAIPAGLRDTAFDRLQVSRWTGASASSRIKWSVEIPTPELSTHQRPMVRAIVRIDGRELEKRRGRGEFVALIQITDAAGRVWQNHTSIDLANMQPYMQNRDIFVTHYVFVLPGDYSVLLGVCDSETLEHSTVTRKVHVDAVRDDPLPHAWDGLPAVEYVPPSEGTPDVWFLPDLSTRLNLSVATKRRVRLQVLVNTTPSERSLGSASALRRNMSLLIPAMKLFSSVEMPNGTLEFGLLDLEHRRVAFEQSGTLDWQDMRRFFDETKPGVVDARTLANEWRMRGFFLEEIQRRMRAPLPEGEARVIVVLSGPAFMEDPSRLFYENEPSDPSRLLFHIRYRTLPLRFPPRNRPGMRPMPQRPVPVNIPMPNDDLQRVITALGGRAFDAISAEQFRRIFAAILEQVGRL